MSGGSRSFFTLKTLTVQDVCSHLGVREPWLMRNCIQTENPMPHTRINDTLFFTPELVDEWIKNRGSGSTDTPPGGQ